jgi:hypothetical protein
MSIKILDISLLTIHVPILSDDANLARQFSGRVSGNDQALRELYSALKNHEPRLMPVNIKMALLEAEPCGGNSSEAMVSEACKAADLLPNLLVQTTIAQIGSLACVFRAEKEIQRIVPVRQGEQMASVGWERSNNPWSSPVIRFHSRDTIQGTAWIMLPIAA